MTKAEKIKWAMVVLFSAIGILLWIGVLFAALVFFGVVWLFCRTMLWIFGLAGSTPRQGVGAGPSRYARPAPRPVAPPRSAAPASPAPAKTPADPDVMPDLIPKWNQAHRRYVDQDRADWQKQFDCLNSRRL